MSEETNIQVFPAQCSDGKFFSAPESMVRGFLGTVAAGSFCDEIPETSILAMELCEIPAVTGVKIEGCEVLVLVGDAGDWDIVEPRILEILDGFLEENHAQGIEVRDLPVEDGKELPPFYRSRLQGEDVAKLPTLSMKLSCDTEPRSDALEKQLYADYIEANLPGLVQEELQEVRKWIHSRLNKSLSIKREPLLEMPDKTSPSYKEELPEPKISGVWPAETPNFILEIPKLPKEEKVRTLSMGNSVVMVMDGK